MKTLQIIFGFIAVFLSMSLVFWQVGLESPALPVLMLFALAFGSILMLCSFFREYYSTE